MRLFMVRHGESEHNLKRWYAGQYDSPLSNSGREQAESLKVFLSQFKFDKVYSSDLSRASETATIAIPGCTPETTKLLRELDVGCLMNTPVDYEAIRKKYGESTPNPITTRDYTQFGGENYEMLAKRISEFCESLVKKDDELVIAFSHAVAISSMIKLTLRNFDIKNIKIPNCNISIFDYNRDVDTWYFTGHISPDFLPGGTKNFKDSLAP